MARKLFRSIAFLPLFGLCGFTATLSLSNQVANPGQTVAAPLLLAAGGAAMVELFISTDSSAAPGVVNVNLANLVTPDGVGEGVLLQGISASVQIQSGIAQSIPAGSVLNAASLLPGAVGPGEIISLLGSFPLAAPMLYAGSGQMNAVVPFGLNLSGPVNLQIRSQNQTTLLVAALAPAMFTQSGTGTGPGAILNQDYSLNTYLAPAAGDSILMVFGTGFGSLQTAVSDGQTVPGAIYLMLSVTATIGGMPAEVTYAGSAPGLVAGVTQVNVRVPTGLPSNPYTPIVLSVGSASTPLGVTVSVR